MTDEMRGDHRIARELAVGQLQDIESALHDAGDIEAMEVVSQAIKELQGNLNSRDQNQTLPRVAAGRLRQAAAAAGSSVQAATDVTAAAVRAGASRAAGDLAAAKTIATEKGGALIRSGASGVAAGFGVAHETLAGFAENLDFSSLTTKQLEKFVTAGLRNDDVRRTLDEAHRVWETIPEQLRALGPEEVGKRLDGFDWSHIVAHSKGGSNEATNGIFELASLNRNRQANEMTAADYATAQNVLADRAFDAALEEVASQVFTGAVVGAAVSCVVSSLEIGLEYQRGDITQDEMYQRLGRAVAKSAGVGGAVAGVMALVALAFPPLIPLAAPLMLPLAVLGFCAVGGKVVRLSKGWYELFQDVAAARQLPAVLPVPTLPEPQSSA